MELYSVVLSGFKRGEEFFRGRMMKQGMKVAQIERVIQAVPCILKQGLSFEDAQRFEGVFRDAGAIVEVRKDGAPAPVEDAAAERPRHSQPRLTPLVQPLPAPPEEPPPVPGGPSLLDLDQAAAPPDSAFAPPPAPGEATLDLLEGAPPVVEPPAPAPDAPAPDAPPAASVAPLTAKPPAVFTTYNPWIFRSIWIGVAFLLSLATVSCVSKYQVAARMHDFSATIDDAMANDLVGVARARGGQVGEDELYKLVDGYARRTHVKVAISNVRVGYAEIVQGPGGMCAGMLPPSVGEMPHDKRMQWMMEVRRCVANPWIIGFDVDISARFGLSRDSIRTSQWIFVADWK